jgi:predicted CoA-binding protein
VKSKTLVIGASENPDRYSYKAVKMLLKHQHQVVAVGLRPGNIDGVQIVKGKPNYGDIHTVTLYVSPLNQEFYLEYIFELNPKRIIFNPGTYNEKLDMMAQEKGIETVEGCTLVMLSLNNY